MLKNLVLIFLFSASKLWATGLGPCPEMDLTHALMLPDSQAIFPSRLSAEDLENYEIARRLQAPLEEAQIAAWAKYPSDPIKRANEISARLAVFNNSWIGENKPNWDAAISINESGQPTYKNTLFSDVLVESDLDMNILIAKSARVRPEDADIILLASHGVGSSYRSPGAHFARWG